MRRLLVAALTAAALVSASASAAPPNADVRFATFNASLNRASAGQLVSQLSAPGVDDVFRHQIRNVAEVVQRVRPDVLLINEFDFDPAAVDLFRDNFLEVSQNGAAPIEYPYAFVAPSNTGIATGKDLNNNGGAVTTPGAPGYGDDAFGFGAFPGQFGMVVYSKYPILLDEVRTFQLFKWKDMPGNLIPPPFYSPDEVDILRLSSKSHWDVPIVIGKKTVHFLVSPPTPRVYSPDELDILRRSSKSHWDVPIVIGRKTVHFLVSHPTPPVFDGPEDRNGRRNHDEIRVWADYVAPGTASPYIYDADA